MSLLRKFHGNTIVLRAAWGRRGIAWRPRREIERRRDKRVRKLVRFAAKTVPFYRDWFARQNLDIRDIRNAEDLSQLPLLQKSMVRENPEQFRSQSRAGQTAIRFTTSGSTGSPLVFYHDRHSLLANMGLTECERAVQASLIGKSLGYRTLRISRQGGTAVKVRAFCNANTLIPARPSQDRMHVDDPPEKVIAAIRDLKPKVLGGYGSYLEMLFRYVHEKGIDIPLPDVVSYAADGMTGPGRELITGVFDLPVAASYNAVECFKIGFQCGEGPPYHLHEDICHVRIADSEGSDVPNGSSGQVVISNLVNRGTVLLNYCIGDVAAMSAEPCACGRSLRLLNDLEGRSEDMLYLDDGGFLHPRAIWGVLRKAEGLLRYQFVQTTPLQFELKLVTTTESAFEEIADWALPELQSLLGGRAGIDIARLDALPPDQAGKFRAVINHWHPGEST